MGSAQPTFQPEVSEKAVPEEKANISQNTRQAISILRAKLLDIGKRNRLIHTPLHNKRSKQLQIVDERSDEIFKILQRTRKPLLLAAIPDRKSDGESENEDETGETIYIPPEDDEVPFARFLLARE